MHIESLYAYCCAKLGAQESLPFGDDVLVFKVGGKMFALFNVEGDPLSINLKCDPERALELRASYAGVQPGYHMNKKHWNTVVVGEDVEDDVVRELIDHSYDLVVARLPSAVRAALQGEERT